MKLKFSFLTYLFVNSLFVLKYTSRLPIFNEYLFTCLYILFTFLFFNLINKISLKDTFYKYSFLIITVFFFLFSIYLNNKINGNLLNVDRWSAMEAGVQALLNNEYPYSAIDHMGGRTSNLPTLIFIGIPFYLLGNIGFLQSFSFLLFAFTMFYCLENYKARFVSLVILIFSPCYLWEIYVKSDIMSNFIIVLAFMIFIYHKFSENKRINTIGLSFLSTSLILTRLIAIIPLTLLLFERFCKFSFKRKIKFIVVGLLTILIFSFICFHNVESLENFKKQNPFELQDRQLPTIISLITILIPIFFSKLIKDLKSLLKNSYIFLLIPISMAFALRIAYKGFYSSIFNSSFDISYFNIMMPFLITYLTLDFLKKPNPKNAVYFNSHI
ncbi:hypothetical protein [Yeosuana aromativorans]|uniref:hypothetical protein n=1 Tax=Yeosuana aromativorans TaxID=288019 RepID=UPI001667F5C5|nr:hypothetical protein [Yeosuana aromativorans]